MRDSLTCEDSKVCSSPLTTGIIDYFCLRLLIPPASTDSCINKYLLHLCTLYNSYITPEIFFYGFYSISFKILTYGSVKMLHTWYFGKCHTVYIFNIQWKTETYSRKIINCVEGWCRCCCKVRKFWVTLQVQVSKSGREMFCNK